MNNLDKKLTNKKLVAHFGLFSIATSLTLVVFGDGPVDPSSLPVQPPSSVLAKVLDKHTVLISWVPVPDDRTGFVVNRVDKNSSESVDFNIFDKNATSFSDTSANYNHSYLYSVRSFNLSVSSYLSEPKVEVSVGAEPAEPPPESLSEVDLAPASSAPVFQHSSMLTGITIEAPLSELYQPSNRNSPEGSKQPSVTGSIKLNDGTVLTGVGFALRGNSSKEMSQCTFAKLSVDLNPKVNQQKLDQSLFKTLSKIKIGTHCGENYTEEGPIWGRELDQHEPIREALIYRILNIVGTVTLRARPATLTYVDTSGSSDLRFFPKGRTMQRYAFFLEDEGDTAKRYNAKVVLKSADATVSDSDIGKFDQVTFSLGMMAEKLTDNVDFMLPRVKRVLWNLDIIRTSDTSINHLLVYDWDISSFAVGWDKRTGIGSSVINGLSTYGIGKAAFQQAAKIYRDHKAQIYQAHADAFSGGVLPDAKGQSMARTLLDRFYSWLDSNPY